MFCSDLGSGLFILNGSGLLINQQSNCMIVTLYILPLPVPSTKKEEAEEGKSK